MIFDPDMHKNQPTQQLVEKGIIPHSVTFPWISPEGSKGVRAMGFSGLSRSYSISVKTLHKPFLTCDLLQRQ